MWNTFSSKNVHFYRFLGHCKAECLQTIAFSLYYVLICKIGQQKCSFQLITIYLNCSPVNLEEDEAIEEAIRLSLLEEAVQPLHDSRYDSYLLVT